MDKSKKIFILILIALLIIGSVFLLSRKKEKVNETEYEITTYNDSFIINVNNCADLTKDEVEEIATEIFCANHNIRRTFYSLDKLQKKDFQMAVWFAKYKLENKTKCSKADFEEVLKDIYNMSFTEHETLENTLEYKGGQYKLKDITFEKYQTPVIRNIIKVNENTYKTYFTLKNTDINYIQEIKYEATIKRNNNNLYIESIIENM